MADEPWARLAELVRRRREQRHLSQRELATAAGTTDRLISSIERAERTTYKPQGLRAIAAALGWTTDSIDHILAGGEPTEVDEADTDQPSIEQRLERIQTDLAWIREQLAGNGGQSRSA